MPNQARTGKLTKKGTHPVWFERANRAGMISFQEIFGSAHRGHPHRASGTARALRVYRRFAFCLRGGAGVGLAAARGSSFWLILLAASLMSSRVRRPFSMTVADFTLKLSASSRI